MKSDSNFVLEALRSATHAAHEALHHHPVLAILLTPDVTHADYARSIRAFSSIYSAAERSLSLAEQQAVPVLEWLEKDRLTHGLGPARSIDSESFDLNWQTPARKLGYFYVKNGSAMGGMVISKKLEKSLGLAPRIDNHFFYGYGLETQAHWTAFTATLATIDSVSLLEATQAASEMFRWVGHCCDMYKDNPW